MSYTHPDQQPAEAPDPRRWLAMATLLTAGFMNLIDITIVNVALPRLQADLGASSTEIEWVVAAYILAFALGVLPFGRLGDVVGRKRMFLAGIALFTLFSTFCGLAPSMGTLIAGRVLQGLASAMMMPQVLAIAQVMFPPRERGLAFSLFGLSAGLASVAGPLVGGLLIGADLFRLDWRPIFLVNIPVGFLAFIAGRALVPALPSHPGLTVDFAGVVISGVSVLLVMFPLIEGHAYGWPAWTFVMIGASLPGFAIFFLNQRSRHRRGLSELLPFGLMTNGSFVLGFVLTMVFFSGVAGFFLVLAVFLQTGFGLTPLQSGLITTPFPSGVLIASLVTGRLAGRWLRERIALGALLQIAGMGLLWVVVSGLGDSIDHWRFVLPLLVCGLGMGIGVAPLFQLALAAVPPRDAGSASGALQSFQQIGSAFGVAITGQIFFASLQSGLASGGEPHAAFAHSLSLALIYEVVAFGLVVVLIFFTRAPKSGAQSGQGRTAARPVPVEGLEGAEESSFCRLREPPAVTAFPRQKVNRPRHLLPGRPALT
jgi:EmrB/QacA subfamily drug resistance transporter